jgi:hypothetical protein
MSGVKNISLSREGGDNKLLAFDTAGSAVGSGAYGGGIGGESEIRENFLTAAAAR